MVVVTRCVPFQNNSVAHSFFSATRRGRADFFWSLLAGPMPPSEIVMEKSGLFIALAINFITFAGYRDDYG